MAGWRSRRRPAIRSPRSNTIARRFWRWETAQRDTTLTTDQKRQEVLKGIAAEDRALAINPDYFEALAYKNILLRMQAVLSDDPQEINDLIKQADQIRNRALTLQADGVNLRADSRGVPPPPPAEMEVLPDPPVSRKMPRRRRHPRRSSRR